MLPSPLSLVSAFSAQSTSYSTSSKLCRQRGQVPRSTGTGIFRSGALNILGRGVEDPNPHRTGRGNGIQGYFALCLQCSNTDMYICMLLHTTYTHVHTRLCIYIYIYMSLCVYVYTHARTNLYINITSFLQMTWFQMLRHLRRVRAGVRSRGFGIYHDIS